MENLYIQQTKSTPKIEFDSNLNKLALSGQSYPENSFKFYEPIFNWLDDYFCQLGSKSMVEVIINLSYFNTSSSKCIMMMLEKFEEAHKNGMDIVINWYYDIENESELECAEEFKEDVILPFNIIPVDTNK